MGCDRAQPQRTHANAIHTDAGAKAAGFPRALVAGVTTYAYLTHPVVAAWGVDWLSEGGGEVRFRSPVFADDAVRCTPRDTDAGSIVIDALCGDDDRPRATFTVVEHGGPPPTMRDGEALRTRRIRLEGEWGSGYGYRAGDDLELYAIDDIVHPAVWPSLANHVMHADVVRGAWIHTRSVIRHHGVAQQGETADVHTVVVDRFERSGERAVLDVLIEVAGRPIASLEHEAIVALPGH